MIDRIDKHFDSQVQQPFETFYDNFIIIYKESWSWNSMQTLEEYNLNETYNFLQVSKGFSEMFSELFGTLPKQSASVKLFYQENIKWNSLSV